MDAKALMWDPWVKEQEYISMSWLCPQNWPTEETKGSLELLLPPKKKNGAEMEKKVFVSYFLYLTGVEKSWERNRQSFKIFNWLIRLDHLLIKALDEPICNN